MHVCFLNGALTNGGGGDRWLFGVVAGSSRAVRTTVLVGREDPGFPHHERVRLGEVVRIRGLDARGLRRGGRGAAERLAAALDGLRPDVVHCNDIWDPALLEVVAATGRGVATVQDHRAFCPGPGKVLPDGSTCGHPAGPACAACLPDDAYRTRMLTLTGERLAALRRMAAVTVLSGYMRASLVQAGLDAERVHVVPPFVDHLPAAPAVSPSHHLFVGRLAAHKGVEVALAAAERLQGGLPLVVAGDGPLRVAVASARVRAVGWVDRPALAALLAGAATLWMPSTWAEPFGIAGLEALAREVPVIGSGRGGMAEWLADGAVGRVVPPEPVALATAADALAADPVRRAAMGRAGRRLVDARYTRDLALGTLGPIYEGVGR